MTYKETIDYLYRQAPMFQNVGSGAYKEGLQTTLILDEHLGHPHQKFKTIHIAGTNGKGSCSHLLASVLQESGYKVGLYTSPHLLDFRERIRVNGVPVSEEYVIEFIERERPFFLPLRPSFFELTTAMAFRYFADREVDVAVIETGLGGRLDCTNIITPVLSIITNISYDHTNLLGSKLGQIAREKAGIIKPGIPVVIGEYQRVTRHVFLDASRRNGSKIIFSEDHPKVVRQHHLSTGVLQLSTTNHGTIFTPLGGIYQKKNSNTVLTALDELRITFDRITDKDILHGFANVISNTGLQGRWQQVHTHPTAICDTGHNVGGFRHISRQLKEQKCNVLRIVFGMVNDKDINGVLSLLPVDAEYYFCSASVSRALDTKSLSALASTHGLNGRCFDDVGTAYETALSDSSGDDFIYIGGSTFIVADLLAHLKSQS